MQTDMIFPDSLARLEEIALKARELGTTDLIVARNFSKDELKEWKAKKVEGIDFHFCHLLEKASILEIQKFENLVDFIAADGKNLTVNKAAVSQKKINFLINPFNSGMLEVDTAVAGQAKNNKIIIVYTVRHFSEAKGFAAAMLFKNAFFASKLFQKAKADAVFFSGAKKPFELKLENQLYSFAMLFGFNERKAKRFTNELPNALVKR